MSFLNRLRGIPDESAPPRAAERIQVEFDLGNLPSPGGEVRAAIDRGQLIAAIKAYREQSGAGLAEAKRVVDALARGDRLMPVGSAGALMSQTEETPGAGAASARVDELIAAGQLIAAIKLYRDTYGTGLGESKEAVESRRDQLAAGEASGESRP